MGCNTIVKIAASVCITLSPNFAFAEFQGFGEKEGLILGIGNISDWSSYDSIDSPSNTTIPYIAYDWENAHFGVDGFNYSFFSTKMSHSSGIEASFLLSPRWTFTDPDDSEKFANINRDTALEAGVNLTAEYSGLFVTATYLGDVSGVHDGLELTLELGFEAELGPFETEFSLGYTHRDELLNLHLYGVKDDEADSVTPTFITESDGFPFIDTQWTLAINARNAVIAFASYEMLSDEIELSPLIAQNYDASVGIAFLRRF